MSKHLSVSYSKAGDLLKVYWDDDPCSADPAPNVYEQITLLRSLADETQIVGCKIHDLSAVLDRAGFELVPKKKALHETLIKPYRLNESIDCTGIKCRRCGVESGLTLKFTPLDEKKHRRVEIFKCESCGPLTIPPDLLVDEGAIVTLMEMWGAEGGGQVLGHMFATLWDANKPKSQP
jgi:hypothetical protein